MIDYRETGEGPVILFVPGSFGTPSAWRALQGHLPSRYRLVSTSLCGYGHTDETRTPADCDIAHEVRVVAEAVLRAGGGPVHLVGHSWGATVAFAYALQHSANVRSITAFEANCPTLLVEAGRDHLLEEMRRLAADFEAAHLAGEGHAARRIIDFWGGEGVFDAMPETVQAYCDRTAGTNVLDWRSYFGFAAGSAELGRLAMPILLVRGALANPAMVAITDSLAACFPAVSTAVVPDAGHFLITSHAAQCAGLLAAFIASVEDGRESPV